MLTAAHASAIIRLCPPLPSYRGRRSKSKSNGLNSSDYLTIEALLDLQEALKTASPSDILLYEEWRKRDRGLPSGDTCPLPVSKDVSKLCKETLLSHQNGNSLTHAAWWVMIDLAAVLLKSLHVCDSLNMCNTPIIPSDTSVVTLSVGDLLISELAGERANVSTQASLDVESQANKLASTVNDFDKSLTQV